MCMAKKLYQEHEFSNGIKDLKKVRRKWNNPRCGRPATSKTGENIEKVREKVRCDRCLTVRMIAEEFHFNKDTVRNVTTENLATRKIGAKMVPKILTDEQKDRRMQVCQEILQHIEDEPDLLERVIRGDE